MPLPHAHTNLAALSSDKLRSELEFKQIQLNTILEITEAINQNNSADQLFKLFESVLSQQLKVRQLALYLVVDKKWKCVLSYGPGKHIKSINVPEHLSPINDLTASVKSNTPGNGDYETIVPVYHKDKALAYALVGGFDDKDHDPELVTVPFIQTITNVIVVAIENKKLAKESIRQIEVKKELDLAAEMQALLFPMSLESSQEDIELAATYHPHHEVGGDYYDYKHLNNDEIMVCMADVSGKGMAAALMMSNFQATLHALLYHHTYLPELISELNTKVYGNAKGEKFITFFIGVFVKSKQELHYVNAGHNPPLLHTRAGDKLYLLNTGTVGLGMFEKLPFVEQGNISVAGGCDLLCYTDGVVDLENDTEEPYGMDRLKDFFLKNSKSGPLKNFNKKLIDNLSKFKQHKSFTDDVTLLTCRYLLEK